MKCPNCEQILQISERQNIEIDYCPNCRGVWLDKGELDKIIEYSNQQLSRGSRKEEDDNQDNKQDKYRKYPPAQYKNDTYASNQPYPHRNHKKKSFLGDLFDFGD
jgi:uncharacterized protein